MQQGGDTPQLGGLQFEGMAEFALRGIALLWDLQMETARNVFRTQARMAASKPRVSRAIARLR